MTPLVIAGLELRRFLRDRSNIFFVFLMPLLLVLLIGAQFGSDATRATVVVSGADTPLRAALVDALRDQDVDVDRAGREGALETVARARADAAVLLDDRAASAYDDGTALRLDVVPSAEVTARSALEQVRVAVAALSTAQGQLQALTERGVGAEEAARALREAREATAEPALEVSTTDGLAEEFAGLGQFDFGASGQLLLFVFLTSLTGATTLLQARRLGVVARTLSTPTTTTRVLAGLALGRFAIAMAQGLYIMAATALLFDVTWGPLPVAVLVLACFALVAAGAAMLLGAAMDNEAAASGVGTGVGLVLAALGGCMFPLELFSGVMATVSRLTPHAWAYEAFADLQRRGGGLLDVLPQLGVLLAMAVAVLLLGAVALRRSLARAL